MACRRPGDKLLSESVIVWRVYESHDLDELSRMNILICSWYDYDIIASHNFEAKKFEKYQVMLIGHIVVVDVV